MLVYQLRAVGSRFAIGASRVQFDSFAALATFLFVSGACVEGIFLDAGRALGRGVTLKAGTAHAGIVAVVQANAVTLLVFPGFSGVAVFATFQGLAAFRTAIDGVHQPKKDIYY